MTIMKKQIKKIVSVVAACAVLMGTICGCQSQESKKEITVTFMNGDEQLGSVSAAAGELVTGYEAYETVENTEFLGWFETPTFLETSKKDLATATFEEDAVLYGSFKSTAVAEDTRLWYVAGTGKSTVLYDSDWGRATDENIKDACQLKATGNAVNEFSITLDMYAGDQFQIIPDWNFDGQKGYGCFTEIDATQMENGGGLGGTDQTSNVNVIMDGNYTITLTTDPDNELQDTLTVVRNGDAAPAEEREPETEEASYVPTETTEVLVKGSWVSDWSENKSLERAEGTDTYAITMELTAGTELYFMIYEDGADTGLGLKYENVTDEESKALLEDSYNVKVLEDGTYTFTVDAAAMTLSVAK